MWFLLFVLLLLPTWGRALSIFCPMDTLADLCTVGSGPTGSDAGRQAWSVTVSTAQKFAGTGALRVEVRSSDLDAAGGPGPGAERSEVRFGGNDNLCQTGVGGAGCWYGWATFIPSDSTGGNPPSPADSWRTNRISPKPGFPYVMHVETRTFGKDACDGAHVTNSSPVRQYLSTGYGTPLRWNMQYTSISKECSVNASDAVFIWLPEFDVQRGIWERHVVFFKPSTRNGTFGSGTSTLNFDGILQMWINDNLRVNLTQIRLGLNNANTELLWDMGVYYSAWETIDPAPNEDVMVMYIDEFRACDKTVDGSCNYESVNPIADPVVSNVTIASAVITNENPNRILVTIDNQGTGPMIPDTGITGFSKTCSVTAVGVTISKASDNQVYLTSTAGPFTAADVCTVGYSPSGNYTNSDGVELLNTTPFPVTNNITVAAATVSQTATRCYMPNVSEAEFNTMAWLNMADAECELPVNSHANVLTQLTLTAGTYNDLPRLFCADNGGARYRVEAAYNGHGLRYASDEVVHATAFTACRLPITGSCAGGHQYSHPGPSSVPVTLATATKHYEIAVALETALAIGETAVCEIRNEDDTALSSYGAGDIYKATLRVSAPTSRGVGGGL